MGSSGCTLSFFRKIKSLQILAGAENQYYTNFSCFHVFFVFLFAKSK